MTHRESPKLPVVFANDRYVYLVPFVEEQDFIFLKTVIPSRKATRDYLNPGDEDGHPN